MRFKIKKGLDLPIVGELTSQEIVAVKSSTEVALVGSDYIGMKPTLLVKEGDEVKIGQPVFECKKNIGVIYTSPAAGIVSEINRGEKRVFESLVIKVDKTETEVSYKNFKSKAAQELTKEDVSSLLIESGEWTAIRQRPFEKVASVHGKPKSLFINAMDTNPLSLNPVEIIKSRKEDFETGALVLSKLTEGNVYICYAQGSEKIVPSGEKFKAIEFAGPHPAGNVGTHIHFVDPVNPKKYVWHLNYQDVIAIGALFKTGKLDLSRVISLAGPLVKSPKVIKIRRGAEIFDLVANELSDKDSARVISGSVLNGRKAEGKVHYFGRYHLQVSAVKEDHSREFLGWQSPGFNKFSVKRIYVSTLFPNKKFAFTTNRNGSYRAMVPIGSYEKVMPLDILPTQLLRSLLSKDTETAQDLGCLELAEEDMALLTFVDPGKIDYGPVLRENLTNIEKEG